MSKEELLGDYLPLDDYISDEPPTILTRTNGVFAVFEVGGVHPDTADEDQIAAWFAQLHNAWLNIHAEDVELFVYQCRGIVDPASYSAPHHTHEFSAELGEAAREALFDASLYSNRLFLGLQIHAPSAAAQSVRRFLAEAHTDPRAGILEREIRLNEICGLLQAHLSRYRLRRLGYVERGGLIYDEVAEALALAGTGIARHVPATTGRMGHNIFSEDFHFRTRRIDIDSPSGTRCGVMFAFKDYSISTAPWMLDPLATAPFACTLAHSYRFLSNAAGTQAFDTKQYKMLLAGDKALDQIENLGHGHQRLLNRELAVGDHSAVLLAFAPTRHALGAVSNSAWRAMAACGLQAKRITRILRPAYLSMFPGNSKRRPRPGIVNTLNFCAFAPLYTWPAGEDRSHWPGPEVALFRTLAGTPFRFHWHPPSTPGSQPNGNTLVTGDSGSGKTTGVGFLIAMTAGRARIIALDHKQGWRFLFRRLGGDYAVIGAGRPSFAPLKALDATPANMEFLTELLRGCIGGAMTEEEGRRLALGLSIVMEQPSAERNLSEVRAFLDGSPEGAGARLDKWCWPDGELGWVIDAPRNAVNLSDLCCVDITALLNNPRARGPSIAYIFHMIDLASDGRPLLIPCDELWRGLDDHFFCSMIENKLRTIRSKNGVLVLITQSPSDITDSRIVRVLVEQCPNQMHFANPRGTRADYVDGLHRTEGQFAAFKELQPGQGLFLLVQGPNAVVCQLYLRDLGHYRDILSAPEIELRAHPEDEYEFQEAAE